MDSVEEHADISGRVIPRNDVTAWTAAIHSEIGRASPWLREANFRRIGTDDLERMFDLYDERFFGGWLRRRLAEKRAGLFFRLSRRMARTGGKIAWHPPGRGRDGWYEIVLASRLLFMTFADVQRPVAMCGLTCHNRLEALQRLLEHEIVHLVEMLAWDQTSCSGQRFRTLASHLFGHTDTNCDLVTPAEQAAVRHGLRPGDMAEFDYDGRRLVGRINRIGQRATVLVADPGGRRYSDGGTYAKFYVPLPSLRPAPPSPRRPAP